MSDCPFCNVSTRDIIYQDQLVIALFDRYPVNEGHCLIIPKRHVSSWFEVTSEENTAIFEAIAACKGLLDKRFRPDGYNVGINIDSAGGQTVPHAHCHLIPRYAGDHANPVGGVRAVIPGKADYIAGGNQPEDPKLITGGDDHFLPHFKDAIEGATSMDFASAFVMQSGVNLIWESLVDFVARGGKARIIAGDYLNYTDPLALAKLLDLGSSIDLRIYETAGKSFHPKAYIFHQAGGQITGFVGSSNLSKTALTDGIEWNYRVIAGGDGAADELANSFEMLLNHPKTTTVTPEWISKYRKRRGDKPKLVPVLAEIDDAYTPPEPHLIQKQALLCLKQTRLSGNQAGLVVLATGLGKTWLSAFDSAAFERVLFVAHREEILNQAISTFRKIRPWSKIGRYTGEEKDPDAEILFASIQTLGRKRHLKKFASDAFDYIIVDEFHHAAARTYRNLIDHFSPHFLLGLTATPDRTDGADLLSICQDNLVFDEDMITGIRAGLLCPFKYFGVPDDIDYEVIPWRSRRFDEEALTLAAATQKRAANALEQFQSKGGSKALGFCCSVRHADFMAEFFRGRGFNAVAVHSEASSYPRARALEELEEGKLQIIFAVDIFNEGLDVPAIDTVLMLRPTESSIVWLQQFGRGLRKLEGKSHLNVIDYIGNHRSFLLKVRSMLLQWEVNVQSDAEISLALKRLDADEVELPEGCEITYELEAKNIINALLRTRDSDDAIITFYQDYLDRNGRRPSAGEVLRSGYNPRSLRKSFGSWFGFIKTSRGFTDDEQKAYDSAIDFFQDLENTPMTKSYKMLLLMALLNLDAIPGSVDEDTVAVEFKRLANRNKRLANDVGPSIHDHKQLVSHLRKNPIAAWTGGKGTGGRSYFSFEDNRLGFLLEIPSQFRSTFQELVREIADWRLGEYYQRIENVVENTFRCKIIHANRRPIVKLPRREKHPAIPHGWEPVVVNGKRVFAKFAKEFINMIRSEPDSDENLLPEILKDWFGEDVGLPGTTFQVEFESIGSRLQMTKVEVNALVEKPLLWEHFRREKIPSMFGEEFKQMVWQQGFVPREKQVFLFVTLDKKQHEERHRYNDYFESSTIFKWQSQNRTAQDSKHGEIISSHNTLGIEIRLFVRKQAKIKSKASPFIYCGEVDFVDWEGEQPISVTWKLRQPVPETLFETLGISKPS